MSVFFKYKQRMYNEENCLYNFRDSPEDENYTIKYSPALSYNVY